MLRELRIGGIAVVEDAQLEPGCAFTVLTGETGSGKSVCVAALRAALGGRVEADLVRPGAAAGRATAVFEPFPAVLSSQLSALGIGEEDLLTLTREITPAGRTSCRINGSLVSQAVLRRVGEALAEVTEQGASQRLLRAGDQRDILDAAGGDATASLGAATRAAWNRWRAALAGLERQRAAARTGEMAQERARELVADLGPLELRAGEREELAQERLRLTHAARLVEAAEALAAAAGDDDTGAADLLAGASAAAEQAATIDPRLGDIASEGAALVERLRDLALEARRYAESIVVDQSRLADVESRLDQIDRVMRRHGSVDDALAALAGARELLAAVEGGDDAMSRCEAEVDAAHTDLAELAARLSAARAQTARRLERTITAELRELELPHARFRVVLGRTPAADGVDLGDGMRIRCAPHGIDDVEFRLVTNRDMLPAPLDQGPSGGELSRLALAVAAVVGGADAPLLVLDEVDAGIGGETAARVGDMLARIGTRRQVIVVTHRPEIAARAASHLLVAKTDESGPPRTTVRQVTADEREQEIARLMSGRVTGAALARARELLQEGAAQATAGGAAAAARTM